MRGYVSTYDAMTGELVSRFYIAPSPNKTPDGAVSNQIFGSLANDTWGDDGAWMTESGGTASGSVVYDFENNCVIVETRNGLPVNPKIRDPNSDRDNLLLSSILARDADTVSNCDA